MKNLFLLSIIFCLLSCGGSTVTEKETGFTLDQSNPESVVQAIFEAAKTGNYDLLTGLCDPLGEGDGDTRRICSAKEASEKDLADFVTYFKDGKTTGAARIENDEAYVPFLFGPDATETEEMVLINREGKWYLYSF
jgi:hypothetical protein